MESRNAVNVGGLVKIGLIKDSVLELCVMKDTLWKLAGFKSTADERRMTEDHLAQRTVDESGIVKLRGRKANKIIIFIAKLAVIPHGCDE